MKDPYVYVVFWAWPPRHQLELQHHKVLSNRPLHSPPQALSESVFLHGGGNEDSPSLRLHAAGG